MSVCLSVCLSVRLYVCLPPSRVNEYIMTLDRSQSINQWLVLCLSVCLSPCLFVCLSVCLFVCPSVCMSATQSCKRIYHDFGSVPVNKSMVGALPVCLSVSLSVCLSVCLPVCLSVCLSVRLSVCMPPRYATQSCKRIYHDFGSVPVNKSMIDALFVSLSVCLPACLPACLSVSIHSSIHHESLLTIRYDMYMKGTKHADMEQWK